MPTAPPRPVELSPEGVNGFLEVAEAVRRHADALLGWHQLAVCAGLEPLANVQVLATAVGIHARSDELVASLELVDNALFALGSHLVAHAPPRMAARRFRSTSQNE